MQLWNLYLRLNSLDRGNLSLRHDRFIDDLVGELREWNLNVLGHLVDLDDGFLSCLLDDFWPLHFDCIDNVLSMRFHTLSFLPSE